MKLRKIIALKHAERVGGASPKDVFIPHALSAFDFRLFDPSLTAGRTMKNCINYIVVDALGGRGPNGKQTSDAVLDNAAFSTGSAERASKDQPELDFEELSEGDCLSEGSVEQESGLGLNGIICEVQPGGSSVLPPQVYSQLKQYVFSAQPAKATENAKAAESAKAVESDSDFCDSPLSPGTQLEFTDFIYVGGVSASKAAVRLSNGLEHFTAAPCFLPGEDLLDYDSVSTLRHSYFNFQHMTTPLDMRSFYDAYPNTIFSNFGLNDFAGNIICRNKIVQRLIIQSVTPEFNPKFLVLDPNNCPDYTKVCDYLGQQIVLKTPGDYRGEGVRVITPENQDQFNDAVQTLAQGKYILAEEFIRHTAIPIGETQPFQNGTRHYLMFDNQADRLTPLMDRQDYAAKPAPVEGQSNDFSETICHSTPEIPLRKEFQVPRIPAEKLKRLTVLLQFISNITTYELLTHLLAQDNDILTNIAVELAQGLNLNQEKFMIMLAQQEVQH